MRRLIPLFLLLLIVSPANTQSTVQYDLVVYGGTAAAVTAAVQAKTMGKSVIIVAPDKNHRVWRHYNQPAAWKWEQREQYGNKGQGTPAMDGEFRTMWIFEPHVAGQVFEQLIREHGITVRRDDWLDRKNGVRKDGSRIVSITTLKGNRLTSRWRGALGGGAPFGTG